MKQLETKVLFVIQPQSMVDVITNSSSELFVFEGKEQEVIESIIKNIYPDYLNEYANLKSLAELNDDDFVDYLDWVYSDWDNKQALSSTFGIDPAIMYSNWDSRLSEKYWYGTISQEGINLIKAQLPVTTTFLLYSLNENPDWEKQGLLGSIGTRYHLG